MQISLKNIDPEVARNILANKETQWTLGIVPKAVTQPNPGPKKGADAGRILTAIFGGIAALFGSLVGLGVAVDYKVPDSLIALCFFVALFVIPICAVNWARTGNLFRNTAVVDAAAAEMPVNLKSVQERPLRSEELQSLGKAEVFSPLQSQYLRALSSLVQLHERGEVNDTRSAALFAHLNGLLVSEHELQAQQASVDSMQQTDQLQQIEAEQKELQARLETVRDAEARRALEQSLEMCESRLTGLKELSPLSERLAAQRTAVEQTLAALEASLSRMMLTMSNKGKPGTDLLNIEGIQQSVTDIQRESRATEQAVQEVMALRAF